METMETQAITATDTRTRTRTHTYFQGSSRPTAAAAPQAQLRGGNSETHREKVKDEQHEVSRKTCRHVVYELKELKLHAAFKLRWKAENCLNLTTNEPPATSQRYI